MTKLLIVCISLIVLSCSSDDDSAQTLPTENIVNPAFDVDLMIGAWVYQSANVNGVVVPYVHNDNCEKDVFGFFNSDIRPFVYEELIHGNNEECSGNQVVMEWKVNGDMLSLYFGEQLVLDYKVISLTTDTFTVETSRDFDNNGTNDVIEITATREDPYGWFE